MHYLMRVRPIQVGSPLVFGGCLDEAFNSLLLNKKNGEPIDVPGAKTTFDQTFSKQKINGIETNLWESGAVRFSKADFDESLLEPEDFISGKDLSWCSLRRKGHMMIDAYADQAIPKIQEVYLIQHEIALENELGDKFTGIVDLLCKWEDGKTYLTDNKSTSVKYDENSASESPQLASYFEALKDDYDIDGVLYITVSKKIRKHKLPRVPIEFVFGKVNDELLEKTFKEYEDVLSGIKRGEFRCSGCRNAKFGCEYRRFCDSGGRDMTGLVKIPDKTTPG